MFVWFRSFSIIRVIANTYLHNNYNCCSSAMNSLFQRIGWSTSKTSLPKILFVLRCYELYYIFWFFPQMIDTWSLTESISNQKNSSITLKEDDVSVSNVRINLTRGRNNPLERYLGNNLLIIQLFFFFFSLELWWILGAHLVLTMAFSTLHVWKIQHQIFQGTKIAFIYIICAFFLYVPFKPD